MNLGNWVSSVILCLENVIVLACYIFDYHELILIILAGNSCEVLCFISLFNFFMFICYYSLKLLRVYESKNLITGCLSTCQLLKKIRLSKNLFTLEYNNAKKVTWQRWNVDTRQCIQVFT